MVETMGARRGLVDRMIGAATLDIPTYEEVEHDTTLTGQAALVVLIVAIARGMGGVVGGASGIIAGVISAFVGWLVWAGVTYLIGAKVFAGTATWGELLRTLGYAQSPGVLYVLAFIPLLGWIVQLGVWIWLLVAGIVAIRQALDFTTGKAIATAGLGWLAMVILGIVLLGPFLAFGR